MEGAGDRAAQQLRGSCRLRFRTAGPRAEHRRRDPYAPHPQECPGPGRGYLAWQRDGVGAGQESVALIAYDEAGMSEAVGSCFEAVAGLEPLTRWTLPASDTHTPASKTAVAPA